MFPPDLLWKWQSSNCQLSFHKRRNHSFNHAVYPYGNVLDSTSGNNKESKHNCFHIVPYMEIARIFYGTIPFLLSSLTSGQTKYQMQCRDLLSCYFFLTNVLKNAIVYFFFINLYLNVRFFWGYLLH